ncbi:metallophosphoesterase [Pontibacterium sp.]|uniref:metallophosphoesterase family protein n=1 Tax=Pontibacterium sp. TaxID=2036026 RepID=UPI00351809BC
MKITIFSDIHGDIYSLESLFERESSDKFICLGDLVGYGPHSNACIELAISKCGVDNIVRGNHEDMFISGRAHESCSPLAKRFFSFSYGLYSEDPRLKKFPNKVVDNGDRNARSLVFTHTLEGRHIYPNTIFQTVESQSIFIGHSHIQFCTGLSSGGNVINVGSLGQNRKQKDIACYANYYVESDSVEYCSFWSPKDRLIQDMMKLNIDEDLLAYYE